MPPRLLLDTNLVILLAVGLTDPELVALHKRTPNGFDQTDFRLLTTVVANSAGLVSCPNVFTQASNLLMQHKGPQRRQTIQVLATLSRRSAEIHVPSGIAMARVEYAALGVTDAVLLELADTGAQLLTIDFDLYGAALAAGRDARNFNHLRGRRPDFRL